MRRSFFLPLLLVAACGTDPASELIGTWIVDLESFKELDAYESMSDADKAQMEMAFNTIAMEATFTSDTVTFTMDMAGKKKSDSASYTIVSRDGAKMKIETVNKKGEKEVVDAELNGDVLVMTKDGMTLALKKKA